MAQQHGSRRDLADKFQEIFAVGVRGEIKILQVAIFGHLSGAGAEHKGFTGFGGLQPAGGRIRVRIADKEDALFFVAGHSLGEVVRRGVFAHHAGGDDKDFAAGELHVFRLSLFEDDQLEGLVEL